jgi:hypothetical protein
MTLNLSTVEDATAYWMYLDDLDVVITPSRGHSRWRLGRNRPLKIGQLLPQVLQGQQE